MYEPAGRQFPYLAFLWPAFAAASASEMAAFAAKQFADFAVGPGGPPAQEPKWATPHKIALELETVRLRDFSVGAGDTPVLLCLPLALHGGAIADLAPGHSLVAALRQAGIRRLFAADWRTARPEMRLLGIDDYLAALNVLVDEIGGPVDLAGLCQGGWMALLYAARFPAKVRKLVLAGAPIDIDAAPSTLSTLAGTSPLEVFRELARLGDGIVPGRKVLKFWGVETPTTEEIRQVLQIDGSTDPDALARLEISFRNWYAWTIDLPGTYFLEVVEKLYKRNELATGSFVALGQRIDLAAIKSPVLLFAAGDDELVAPEQLFAVEHLVGTAAGSIKKITSPCRHVALFMGKTVLNEVWPNIVRWLREPTVIAPQEAQKRVLERVK